MNTLVNAALTNGVKLTKPETNLLNKLEETYGLKVNDANARNEMFNRFGTGAATVSALVSVLVSFVYGCDTGFGPVMYNGKKVTISDFDRTRYLVLKLDSKAYSVLLD